MLSPVWHGGIPSNLDVPEATLSLSQNLIAISYNNRGLGHLCINEVRSKNKGAFEQVHGLLGILLSTTPTRY